jgi:5-methylcytosine-specific restriction protein B
MNTADKSLSVMDLALRRRFEFVLMSPEPELTTESYGGINVRALFTDLNRRLSALNGRENLVGHADFMEAKLEELRLRESYADTPEGRLRAVMHTLRKKTAPFLVDLFRGDLNSVRFVLGAQFFEEEDLSDLAADLAQYGELDSSGMWHLADWWDPASPSWDLKKVEAALGKYLLPA